MRTAGVTANEQAGSVSQPGRPSRANVSRRAAKTEKAAFWACWGEQRDGAASVSSGRGLLRQRRVWAYSALSSSFIRFLLALQLRE